MLIAINFSPEGTAGGGGFVSPVIYSWGRRLGEKRRLRQQRRIVNYDLVAGTFGRLKETC